LQSVRILVFHGYLLGGTGSNVYNARLAEALIGLGHEVHLISQERHPESLPFVSATGVWEDGSLRVRTVRSGSCTAYRPDIGSLLPVYVQDHYQGLEARTFLDCSDAQVSAYVQANVNAAQEVAQRVRPDVALANHLVMGPVILARALRGGVPYAVKVHGSALEYTVKRDPQRFLAPAREGVASASAVLVGSRHTAESLWDALGDPTLPERTRLGPPGVDIGRFAPREPEQARRSLAELVERLRSGSTPVGDTEGAFARDELAVADALERVCVGEGEMVAFVGKLIAAKGVELLLAAWPLVLARRPSARLLIAGFGGERERFQAMAAPLGEGVIFTGRLDHDELADTLALCEALVVPSIFPEAFGMVAAEAAACGVLPVSARHSGLAEVSEALAREVPAKAAKWLSFPLDDRAAEAIAERVVAYLEADHALKARTRSALVAVVRERWSWEGVARGVTAAARGQLDRLAPVGRMVPSGRPALG
jgi:glycosyltransferase involved in cell wall biosynthesis